MAESPRFLEEQLQALAAALDQQAPPVTADEVRQRKARGPSRTRQRVALAVAAAVLAAVAGVGVWLANDGGDDDTMLTPDPDPTDVTEPTVPTTPSTEPGAAVPDWGDLPDMGVSVQHLDGSVDLFAIDGTSLGTWPAPGDGYVDGPQIAVYPGELAGPATADVEVPSGCSAAAAAGGTRLALCADQADALPVRTDRVDSAGVVTPLVTTPAADGEPPVGHWRWVLPSPDGRRALAQWSGECEVPTAFVIDVETGEMATVTGEQGEVWTEAPASRGLGWAPDGRAVVDLSASECGDASPEPGAHLLDPATGDLELVVRAEPTDVVQVWRRSYYGSALEARLSQALHELGLEQRGGEPSHGSPSVTSGAVHEGHEIGISAAPTGMVPVDVTGAQIMPMAHGEAAILPGTVPGAPLIVFACGGNTWRLSWLDDGSAEVDSMLLLAEDLLPNLGCTLGDPPQP